MGLLKSLKIRNQGTFFIVYSILVYLERLGNTSTVQGVLALIVQQIPNQIFLKDVIVLKNMIFTCNQFESESFYHMAEKEYETICTQLWDCVPEKNQFAIFILASRCQYPKVKKLPSSQIELERVKLEQGVYVFWMSPFER